jgi:hypothetical protein
VDPGHDPEKYAGAGYFITGRGIMGGINRRDFIKNVAIGSAMLGVGNAVFNKSSKAQKSGIRRCFSHSGRGHNSL